MTNDKDLFSQLDDLFEEVNVDQASMLAGGEIQPTQEDYEKELIEKLNNNEIELTDDVVREIKANITEGGDVDTRLTEYLRNKYALDEEQEDAERTAQEYIPDYVQPESIEEEEEISESPFDHIQSLADSLSGYVKKNNQQVITSDSESGQLEEKVEYLTNQLGIIRQTLDEQGQTIVAGIGQGGDGQSPGSGEVRLQKMDDVDMDGIKPGQTVCWDPDLNSGTGGWYPCDGGGGSGGGGTIQPPTAGTVFGCKKVRDCADLYWGPQSVYETWYDGGNLFGDLTGAKLVRTDIKSITGTIAMGYEPQGTVPETFYSQSWNAVGATNCDDKVLDSDEISTEGISSPTGPEGYFLVYDDPDSCGDDQDGCQPLPIKPIGCAVLEPAGDYTNKLVWGSQDDYDNYDPEAAEPLGTPILDDGSEIEGVTEIKAITFEGCDRDSMKGKYNVYYTSVDATDIKVASIFDNSFDVDTRSAFIADAECDVNIPEEPLPPTVPGCLASEGCKEVSDVDGDGNPNNDGRLYWGNGIEAESLPVDDNGLYVDGVQKLNFVVSAPGTRYVIEDDGTITGDWLLTYTKFDGNIDTVIYEGNIDPATCEIGFFIVSDNECLNPSVEAPEEGTTLPWPGNITGCEALDDVASTGALLWGDGTTGASSYSSPGSNGDKVIDCKRILYVFSTDPNVNETDKEGIWAAVYEKIGGGFAIGYSPTVTDDGTTEGFFIQDNGHCLDDVSDLPELQFGIFTGCRERLTASQLYWGRKSQYIALTGEDVNYSNGTLADKVKRVYRPMTLDNKVYFSLVITDLNQTKLVVHRQDGSETSSPPFGFYLLGDCLVDIEEDNCPLDETEYAQPEGCRETEEGTNLLWGPVSDIDVFATSEVIDTDVVKILRVSTDDKCDNNYGKWDCLYVKLVGGVEEVRQATREGIYPADPIEDSTAFFLDTTDVKCKNDPGDIIGNGIPVRGEITGCRKTLLTTGTTLHWGDGTTGDLIKDVDGNDVTDATFIVGVVSFNSDNLKFGDWICVFKRADGTSGTTITYGQSPSEGYYLDGTNCDPDECEGDVHFGFLPDCNRVDPNYSAGELYWNDGSDNTTGITDGSTQLLARRVLATFTVDTCDNPDFDITSDQEWSAIYLDENEKLVVAGQQFGKSPLGGYYIEVDNVDSYCEYSPEEPIGGRCEEDKDCPEGFVCIGGICAQIECPGGDRDCPAGFLCVQGICLKPCGDEEGMLCPPGFHCQTIDGESYCVPGKGCNGECPEGYHCLDGECVIIECPLNSSNECPSGYECVGGLCLKPCPNGDECPDGFQCIDGHCHPIYGPCTVPCPAGYECILGACREYCDVNDDQCGEGFLCFDGVCLPECPPEGCPTGHVCIGGVCLPIGPGPEFPGGCDDGTDCPTPPTGEIWDCINGHCRPTCQPDGTGCPGDLVCVDGGCYPPCDGTECPPGYECLLGACIPVIGCNANDDCPTGLECIDGLCRPSCTIDSDCPDGFECGPNGGCYRPCDDGTCPEGFMCIGGLCIPNIDCGNDGECPSNFVCFDGICRPDCSVNGCPDGYECYNGVCFPTCPGGSDNECPPGHECVGGGICLPLIGCEDDVDCPTGFECFNGKCRPSCTSDTDCPGEMECVGNICLKPCNGDNDCPPGFICWDGHCVPGGKPEGECGPDGECPPGYICIVGICRPQCVVDGDCPNDNETCLTPPGACFPAQCDEDADCPNGTICIDGRCRVGCNLNSDCPEGYGCIDGICLPIVPEGPGPDQPVDPGPNEHPKIGCEEVDVEGYLYWGSDNNYATGSGGELVLENGNPILVKKIELVVASDVYPNGFGTYTCFYRPPGSSDVKSISLYRQSPSGGLVNSYYVDPINGSVCINFGETHEPYFGLIAGCKETDNGGTIHWGTIAEGISDNYPNEPLKNSDGSNIIAKGIITVFSVDSIDLDDGDPGQTGIWNIFYQNLNGTNSLTKVYGRSGPQGPEGTFMRAASGSVCIDNPLGRVTTRDVVLVNTPRAVETSKRFFGDSRGALGDGPQGTNDIVGPDGELIRYETQEQANILNLDILNELHTLKPTVHIIPDINDVKGHYVPQRGDLWIDPTDYSIYVCEFRTVNPSDDDLINKPDENVFWIELGAASGGGEDNVTQSFSNIWLQDSEPPISIAKNGDLWIDAETYIIYTYNFSAKSWISVTGDLKAVLDNRFEVHVDSIQPLKGTTKSGDLWFDTDSAEMRVAYIPSGSTDFVWVPVQGTGYKSIPATTAFEVNAEVEELKNEISRMSARLSILESQENQ